MPEPLLNVRKRDASASQVDRRLVAQVVEPKASVPDSGNCPAVEAGAVATPAGREVGEDSIDEITVHGFFSPVGFIRGSPEGLIAAGAESAAANMLALKTQVQESDDLVTVLGLDNIVDLQTHISTYLSSQVLIILALPIMIMSLMLTIFTSETSIVNRRGEVSALRAKGASFNQIFTGFMWESLILGLSGLFFGILFSIGMAPLMGSSTGLLTFNPATYAIFLNALDLPISALALAGAIAMFLPASYLFHVSRRIDVSEIGQPTVRQTYDEIRETMALATRPGSHRHDVRVAQVPAPRVRPTAEARRTGARGSGAP